jgi:nitrate reductase gamma subunit
MIFLRYRFFRAGDSTGETSRARDKVHDREAQSMTTTKTMWLASLVTAINVLVAAGFSITGLIHPQAMLPTGAVPTEASSLFAMYAAARHSARLDHLGGDPGAVRRRPY